MHTLCKRTKTLSIGEYVLGSKGSRHSKSRMVLAECLISDGRIELVDVLYFIECVVSQRDGVSAKHTKIWCACVNRYFEHPCKLWYGSPVQVWTTLTAPNCFVIPVSSIKSRLVYVKCNRDFG